MHNKKLEQKEQVISSLEEQITKAQYEQSTLTKQLADITQERDSLILAFSLITDDKPSGQDYEYSCKTFKKPKRNVKMSNLLGNQPMLLAAFAAIATLF